VTKKLSTRVEYGKILVELGAKHKDIVVLDADLSGSTQTARFGKVFQDRFFNLGIAEQDLMSTAAGFAVSGKIPFASFATGRAWEQIRQSIAYAAINVKIVASHGGVTVGEDGGSHQAIEDIALMRILPNMTVLVPADGIEVQRMVEWAVAYHGPVYIRTSRHPFPVIFDDTFEFQVGRGTVLREGHDVTLAGIGLMVHHCLEAAALLAAQGVSARVLNLSSVKPLDWELIVDSARQTGAFVTAEEHLVTGGLGSAVAEVLGEYQPVPLKRIGVKDTFGVSGRPDVLLEHFGLMPQDIVKAAHRAIQSKSSLNQELKQTR
jgi:transketolase